MTMPESNIVQTQSLPIPMTQKAIGIAKQFRAEQLEPNKAEQVYLNTLAVWAVHDYLQLMNIETDLKASQSWNPVLRMCADVADLSVEGLGKLECRPVKASARPIRDAKINIVIPPEVWDDRIGYLVVEIDESQQMATLLGFTPTAGTGEIAVEQLESLDAFLAHLDALSQPRILLSQWFQQVFEAGWQEVEWLLETELEALAPRERPEASVTLSQWFQNLLAPPKPKAALAFRGRRRIGQLLPESSIARAKLVDLGMQLGNRAIALLVALTQDGDRKVGILVQVHPTRGEKYLPPNLKLALLSETGETLQDVQSKGLDLYIQLRPFKALPQTRFSLQVAIGELSLTEAFAI